MRSVCATLPKTKSGQPAFDETSHIRWQFYEAMLFMKDCFIGRDMISSLADEDDVPDNTSTTMDISATADTSPINEDDDEQSSSLDRSISSTDQPTTSTSGTTKRKMTKTDKIIDFEHKKLKALTDILSKEEKPPTDEWQKFTDSLTDDLRYIKHPMLKTQVKTGITNLISQYIEKQYDRNLSQDVFQISE